MATKRRTPMDIDGEKILASWKRLHKEYTDMGLSNHQAHIQISMLYHCSSQTVRYHLRPDVRREKTEQKRISYVPYSKSPRLESKRIQSRLYVDIKRNIDVYLKDVWCGRDVPLTLDQITDRLHQLTGVDYRNQTILRYADTWSQNHGKQLLVEYNDRNPSVYRLESSD